MTGFRDATEADLPAIVGLLVDDTLGQNREDPDTPFAPHYVEGFRRMIAAGGRIILALDGETVVGCLQLDILHGVSQRGTTRAQVEGVRIASSHRGTGAGSALMAEAIRQARAAGATAMQLTTNLKRVDAQRFYRRLGFVQSHAGMKLKL